jgi:hypothetical protein
VIRFPRQHLADQTAARIHIAAQRSRASAPMLEPDDSELVPLPIRGVGAVAPGAAPPNAREAEVTGAAELPPLDASGLDMGAVLSGADSFDALMAGASNK